MSLDPDEYCCNSGNRQVAFRSFFVPRRKAAELLESQVAALDEVAVLVVLPVKGNGTPALLAFLEAVFTLVFALRNQ